MSGGGDARHSVMVSVVTRDTVFVADLELPALELAGSTYHFRLLELLNNPRIGGLSQGLYQDSLRLENAYFLPEEGPRIAVAPVLFVRPAHLVCAYEYASEGEPTGVEYDPRRFRRPERVVIALSNDMLIDGDVLGGVAALAAPHTQRRFIPVVGASLASSKKPQARLGLPFVAVNNEAIVAFSHALEAPG